MSVELEQFRCGCWVLWARGPAGWRVAGEGRFWLGPLAYVWARLRG